jgi:hypothetical protein
MTVLTWGTPAAPAPSNELDPADGLQPMVDALSSVGGVIELPDAGTYYADPGSPTTPLTIDDPGSIIIRGRGQNATKIGSPILCRTDRLGLEHLTVRPAGQAYGVKFALAGQFLARSWMKDVFIGASSAGAGDGPTDGLILDGNGVFLAHQLTCAFCTGHGLLVDSTSVEPNTTLKFDMCSFVGNGGYGAKLLASALIAEFNGGNMEQNTLGELYAESMNLLHLRAVDFETATAIFGQQVHLVTSNPVIIDGCHFITAAGKATRAVLAQSCVGVEIKGSRFSGWSAAGVVRIDENSTKSHVHDNILLTNQWIEDYSA